MVFFVTRKFFVKKAKKLVSPKQYVIIDATGSGSNGDIAGYANHHSHDALVPDKKLIRVLDYDGNEECEEIDPDKIEIMKKKFLKSRKIHISMLAIVKLLISDNGNINIFVVYEKKAYKRIVPAVIAKMVKLIGYDKSYIFTEEEIEENPKLLRMSFKQDAFESLSKKYKEAEDTFVEETKMNTNPNKPVKKKKKPDKTNSTKAKKKSDSEHVDKELMKYFNLEDYSLN